jgi:hypothetical protein
MNYNSFLSENYHKRRMQFSTYYKRGNKNAARDWHTCFHIYNEEMDLNKMVSYNFYVFYEDLEYFKEKIFSYLNELPQSNNMENVLFISSTINLESNRMAETNFFNLNNVNYFIALIYILRQFKQKNYFEYDKEFEELGYFTRSNLMTTDENNKIFNALYEI